MLRVKCPIDLRIDLINNDNYYNVSILSKSHDYKLIDEDKYNDSY